MNRCLLMILMSLIVSISTRADTPRTLYVINESAETISTMDMETRTIQTNVVETGLYPNQIAVHNDLIYIVNSGTDDITVLDPADDNRIVRTIALPEGSNPWSIGFVGAARAYVTNWIASTVSVVDLENGSVTGEIPVGRAPQGILVHENRAFIANTGYTGWGLPFDQATVSIIDILSDSVTHTLNVPVNAQDMAVDPAGRIHVVCTGDYTTVSGRIAVIDLYTGDFWDTPAVVDTIAFRWITPGTTTFQPADLAITTDGTGYCIAWGDGDHGFMCTYDANTGAVLRDADDPIHIGPNVSQLLFDPQENVLWIPTMTFWGGDGFVQKFDVTCDSVTWISDVLGNGTKSLVILEPVVDCAPGADDVVVFHPGDGAGFGQNFFPDNVLGLPDSDPALNAYNGSSKPEEILSLGHGGEIVLAFSDNTITDGEGPDFTVFENVFINAWTEEPFIEAGIVSVSMDGDEYVTFPYDTATWEGLAGVSPMLDNRHPTDPGLSGGDQFDLADVGISYARYVKITDLGDIKSEGDWNGDFDLDAVVAVNSIAVSTSFTDPIDTDAPSVFILSQNYPNPFNPETILSFSITRAQHVNLTIYNTLGQAVITLVDDLRQTGTHHIRWDGRDDTGRSVTSGLYICRLKNGMQAETKSMLLIR